MHIVDVVFSGLDPHARKREGAIKENIFVGTGGGKEGRKEGRGDVIKEEQDMLVE